MSGEGVLLLLKGVAVRCLGVVAVCAAALLLVAPGAFAGTRASLTWDTDGVDIDLHVYDAEGHHAWYADMTGIPGAHQTYDNVWGFPSNTTPEDFVETDPEGRELAFRVCYFSGGADTPSTTTTLVITDPDGGTRTLTTQLDEVNECKDVSMSPAGRQIPPVASLGSSTASVMSDPFTGEIDVWMPSSDRSALTVTRRFDCSPASITPTNVRAVLLQGGTEVASHAATQVDHGNGSVYEATFDETELLHGLRIALTGECSGSPTELPVGSLTLIDPSGRVTDAVSGLPVTGATVTLHHMTGWTPRASAADNTTPNTCETPESKATGAAWSQPVPDGGGTATDPLDPIHVIDPSANPMTTNADGRYAWNVIGGYCWYVTVAKDGYHTLTSTLVGVTALPILDLDLSLRPVSVPAGQTPVTPVPSTEPTPTRQIKTILSFQLRGPKTRMMATGRLLPATRNNPCGRSARIVLQRKAGASKRKGSSAGTWTTVSRFQAASNGKWSVRFAWGKGKYRAVYLGTSTADAICLGATSGTRRR